MSEQVQNRPVSLVGRLGRDPKLDQMPDGKPVANFSLAHTERVRQGEQWVDGETTWYQVGVFGEQATHVAESLHKGEEAVVLGKQSDREFERRDGGKDVSHDVTADFVAPSLRWNSYEMVQRLERSATPSAAPTASIA
jgi:single-strand DNA-binding protein